MTQTPPSTVFVGVSGASGAPYVLRLVQALAAAGCALQLCVSDSGVLVLEHELELPARGRDAVTAAFLARAGQPVASALRMIAERNAAHAARGPSHVAHMLFREPYGLAFFCGKEQFLMDVGQFYFY